MWFIALYQHASLIQHVIVPLECVILETIRPEHTAAAVGHTD